MKCRRLTLIISIVLLCCQSNSAVPQVRHGSLQGTVTDVVGAAVPGAAITAEYKGAPDIKSKRMFNAETNSEGVFALNDLPAGVYELRVSARGFGTYTEKLVVLPRGKVIKVTIQVGRGCDRLSDGSGSVSDKDKAGIIRDALLASLDPKLGLLMQEQQEAGVILSTKNIRPAWVKDVPGVGLKLMTQKQIQRKADGEGDFLYVSFPEIRVRGKCVAVTVANTWAVGKSSGVGYLSGGGHTYEYRQEAGKWVGQFVGGWIS